MFACAAYGTLRRHAVPRCRVCQAVSVGLYVRSSSMALLSVFQAIFFQDRQQHNSVATCIPTGQSAGQPSPVQPSGFSRSPFSCMR